jgi:glycosyltransferase involved in cell wall biosynthesis
MLFRPTPLVVIGDAPTQPSGLGRIGRDLCTLIHRHHSDEIALLQIGLQLSSGSYAWKGPWPLVTFSAEEGRMGATALAKVLQSYQGRKGIVFGLWDAHFCWELLDTVRAYGWDFWIYPPVDAVNPFGTWGGPAAEVVRRADRVLAYGAWGAQILENIRERPVAHLPLGIGSIWQPPEAPPSGPSRIGCVATNSPRKDLHLFVAILAELRRRGHDLSAWLVTDTLVKGWSIPELMRMYKIHPEELRVYTNADRLGDQDLLKLYQGSSITIAPGLGEGFGYPIVESLACGVEVVHGEYAGGAELLPLRTSDPPLRHAIYPQPVAWRTEGIYALTRPIYTPEDFVNSVEWLWKDPQSRVTCITAAARFRWEAIWPQWSDWILDGVRQYRGLA